MLKTSLIRFKKIVAVMALVATFATTLPQLAFASGPYLYGATVSQNSNSIGNGYMATFTFYLNTTNPFGAVAFTRIYDTNNTSHDVKRWGNMPIQNDSNTLQWDGLDYSLSTPTAVTGTNYTFAVNLIGGPIITVPFTVSGGVSGSVPVILQNTVSASQYTIDLAQNQQTTITYSLDKAATNGTSVTFTNGSTVVSVNGSGSGNTYTATWNGHDNAGNGNPVPVGTYSSRINAANNVGNAITVNGPSITVVNNTVNTPPNVTDLSVPNPTTIDQNLQQQTVITYTLDKSATNGTYIIFTNGGTSATVYGTLQSSNTNAYVYKVFWNGTNTNGNVPVGAYTYTVYANNVALRQGTTSVNVINNGSINPTPNILDLSIPNPSTIDLAQNQQTTITYTLDKLATSSYITFTNGSTSATVNATLQSSNPNVNTYIYRVIWNGTNTNGNGNVPVGTYTYTVYANNVALRQGSSSISVNNGSVNLDPNISNISASKSTIDISLQQTTAITYTLDKQSSNTFVTFANGNISTAVKASLQSSGNNTYIYKATWDGTYVGGYVPSAFYTYTASAGNNTLIGGTIQVINSTNNNSAPVILSYTPSQTTINPSSGQTTTITYTLDKQATNGTSVTFNGTSVTLTGVSQNNGNNNTYTYAVTWNGRDSNGNGNIVSNGSYSYTISASNGNGTGSINSQTPITVVSSSTSVPVIYNLSANPTSFDPNNNGSTIVTYYLDKTANSATVDFIDSNNITRKSFTGTTNVNSVNTVTWYGNDSSGYALPSSYGTGTAYTVRVTANNSSGPGTNSTTVYLTNGSNNNGNCSNTYGTPNVNNVSLSRTTFNPNNNDNLGIYYNVDRAAYVTVEVLNSSNTVIRNLLSNSCQNYQNSNYSLNWNGKDSSGNIINDNYSIRITARTNSGSSDIEYAYVQVTGGNGSGGNNGGTIITRIYAYPQSFNPKRSQSTTVYFNLSQAATVNVDVLDRNGSLVKNIVSSAYRSATSYPCSINGVSYNYCDTWYGNDNSGSYRNDGVYQFRVRANTTNNQSETMTAWTELDTDGTLIGLPTDDNGNDNGNCAGYTDVRASDPYCDAIKSMKNLKAFTGYSNNTFRPYQLINRAEVAKVLAIMFNIPTSSGTNYLGFNDTNNSAWYAPYLYALKIRGIFKGYPNGSFRPTQSISKVELAKTFLKSAPNLVVPYCNYAPYNDTPVRSDTRWYMDYVCFVKNNNLMEDDGSGNFNPDQMMTRGDVADFFYRYQNMESGQYQY